jgi:hypothetical protein
LSRSDSSFLVVLTFNNIVVGLSAIRLIRFKTGIGRETSHSNIMTHSLVSNIMAPGILDSSRNTSSNNEGDLNTALYDW